MNQPKYCLAKVTIPEEFDTPERYANINYNC